MTEPNIKVAFNKSELEELLNGFKKLNNETKDARSSNQRTDQMARGSGQIGAQGQELKNAPEYARNQKAVAESSKMLEEAIKSQIKSVKEHTDAVNHLKDQISKELNKESENYKKLNSQLEDNVGHVKSFSSALETSKSQLIANGKLSDAAASASAAASKAAADAAAKVAAPASGGGGGGVGGGLGGAIVGQLLGPLTIAAGVATIAKGIGAAYTRFAVEDKREDRYRNSDSAGLANASVRYGLEKISNGGFLKEQYFAKEIIKGRDDKIEGRFKKEADAKKSIDDGKQMFANSLKVVGALAIGAAAIAASPFTAGTSLAMGAAGATALGLIGTGAVATGLGNEWSDRDINNRSKNDSKSQKAYATTVAKQAMEADIQFTQDVISKNAYKSFMYDKNIENMDEQYALSSATGGAIQQASGRFTNQELMGAAGALGGGASSLIMNEKSLENALGLQSRGMGAVSGAMAQASRFGGTPEFLTDKFRKIMGDAVTTGVINSGMPNELSQFATGVAGIATSLQSSDLTEISGALANMIKGVSDTGLPITMQTSQNIQDAYLQREMAGRSMEGTVGVAKWSSLMNNENLVGEDGDKEQLVRHLGEMTKGSYMYKKYRKNFSGNEEKFNKFRKDSFEEQSADGDREGLKLIQEGDAEKIRAYYDNKSDKRFLGKSAGEQLTVAQSMIFNGNKTTGKKEDNFSTLNQQAAKAQQTLLENIIRKKAREEADTYTVDLQKRELGPMQYEAFKGDKDEITKRVGESLANKEIKAIENAKDLDTKLNSETGKPLVDAAEYLIRAGNLLKGFGEKSSKTENATAVKTPTSKGGRYGNSN